MAKSNKPGASGNGKAKSKRAINKQAGQAQPINAQPDPIEIKMEPVEEGENRENIAQPSHATPTVSANVGGRPRSSMSRLLLPNIFNRNSSIGEGNVSNARENVDSVNRVSSSSLGSAIVNSAIKLISYVVPNGNRTSEVRIKVEAEEEPSSSSSMEAGESPPVASTSSASASHSAASDLPQPEKPPHDDHCFVCHDEIGDKNARPCDTCLLNYHKRCAPKNRHFNKFKSVVEEYRKLHSNNTEHEMDPDIQKLSDCAQSGTRLACNECSLMVAGKLYSKSYYGVKRAEAKENDVEATFWNLACCLADRWIAPLKCKAEEKKERVKVFELKNDKTTLLASPVSLDQFTNKALNVNGNQYNSVEEVLFHFKMFIHNQIILSKDDKKNQILIKKKAKELSKFCQTEASQINSCDSCCRSYYKDKDTLPSISVSNSQLGSSLLLPCQFPHEIVWFKSGKQWWPALAYPYYNKYSLTIDETKVMIHPFGGQDVREVKSNKLYCYSYNPPEGSSIDVNDNIYKDAIVKAQYYATHQSRRIINYQVPRDAMKFEHRDNFYLQWKDEYLAEREQMESNKEKETWECCLEGCGNIAHEAFHMCVQSFCCKEHRAEYLTVDVAKLLEKHPFFTEYHNKADESAANECRLKRSTRSTIKTRSSKK